MRTRQEIVDEYRRIKNAHGDFLGFKGEVLLMYLDTEQVREFCKAGADLSDWEADPLTSDGVVDRMRDYMPFAWEKAENHRGISAGRSVQKMECWLWLLEDDELVAFARGDGNYPNYGAPILRRICEKYEFPIPESEALARMSAGKGCSSDCMEGCGS